MKRFTPSVLLILVLFVSLGCIRPRPCSSNRQVHAVSGYQNHSRSRKPTNGTEGAT